MILTLVILVLTKEVTYASKVLQRTINMEASLTNLYVLIYAI